MGLYEDATEHSDLIFDIETDGLLDSLTKIHSIVIYNLVTTETFSAHGDTLPKALSMLEQATRLYAHNGICFDIPAIQKLYPEWEFKGKVFDTLNAARLVFPHIQDLDFKEGKKKKPKYQLPPRLCGSHSLEAWGHRLGKLKGEFGKTTTWQEWSPQMQQYCEQDVNVTKALYSHIISSPHFNTRSFELEIAFQEILFQQEVVGFPFDEEKAGQFYASLCAERQEVTETLQQAFPPEIVEEVFVPRVNNKSRGYVKGVPYIKRKEVVFNPGSRQQVVQRLVKKYNWQPGVFTESGAAKVDGEVLSSLPYAECKPLALYYDLQKIVGMLAEGDNAWLKLVKNGRIHGRVITNGAVTGRCTHSKPNLGQVPRMGELGKRCRELFVAPKNWFMFGGDASGLELRMLAHYMARYDGGAYVKIVTEGDPHTANQKAAGLPTRDAAKTFILNLG